MAVYRVTNKKTGEQTRLLYCYLPAHAKIRIRDEKGWNPDDCEFINEDDERMAQNPKHWRGD